MLPITHINVTAVQRSLEKEIHDARRPAWVRGDTSQRGALEIKLLSVGQRLSTAMAALLRWCAIRRQWRFHSPGWIPRPARQTRFCQPAGARRSVLKERGLPARR